MRCPGNQIWLAPDRTMPKSIPRATATLGPSAVSVGPAIEYPTAAAKVQTKHWTASVSARRHPPTGSVTPRMTSKGNSVATARPDGRRIADRGGLAGISEPGCDATESCASTDSFLSDRESNPGVLLASARLHEQASRQWVRLPGPDSHHLADTSAGTGPMVQVHPYQAPVCASWDGVADVGRALASSAFAAGGGAVQRFIEMLENVHGALEPKLCLLAPPRRHPECPPPVWVAEQSIDRTRKARGVVWRDEEALDAVVDERGNASDTGGHDRLSRCHPFEDGQRRTFEG